MNIIYRKTGELIPYDRNPRKNDGAVDAVANSIKEFGFKIPIIIDSNDVIVCGHTRLKAANQLGLKEVPWLKAQEKGTPVELCCAIGDDTIDGRPYSEIVEIARAYINLVGGFEKFAEWGLV